MNAAKTWCLAGLMVAVGLATASCGKDETSGGAGGRGSILGGSGGGGTGGGRTDGGSTSAATKLGQACLNDAQCVDAKAPGLTCITSKQTLLGDGAPPKGLCTTSCSLSPEPGAEDECAAFGPGALCFPFDDQSDTGYCIEGCSFGDPDIGAPAKCHDRPEFACNPALLGRTSTSCSTTDDCGAGELCLDGVCDVVFPGCLPACRGDIDCDAGMYCDQSFLNGTCVTKKQTGKALGEPCTVPDDSEPAEPDECIGFCQSDGIPNSNKGHCANTCGLATQCAWNAKTNKFDGVCFYASVLTAEVGGVGDFGFCTPSCNCTTECNDPALACQLLTQGALSDDFKGPGLCFSADAKTPEYNQCADGTGGAGTGGAGGESAAGGAGSGGDPSGSAGEAASGGVGGALP